MSAQRRQRARVLIADDEHLARERVRHMLGGNPAFEIIAECEDGMETAQAIRELRPDVVFLDISMPKLDGVALADTLRHLPVKRLPVIVFVTAHEGHALRAFDVGAVDYLLKPYSQARFEEALRRASDLLKSRATEVWDSEGPTSDALRSIPLAQPADRLPWKVLVRVNREYMFLAPDDIDWVDAKGNYVRIHTSTRVHMVRETLSSFHKRLPAAEFVRVHRSAVVNARRIVKLEPYKRGEFVVVLKGGLRLRTSRQHGAALHALVRQRRA
jgi:two-component system LytT family response regulator